MDKTDGLNAFFAGGTDALFYKGTNGRWKGILADSDLALYEEARTSVLTPDLQVGWSRAIWEIE